MPESRNSADLRSALNRRAYETMVDGRLHSFDELLADLGRLVPPGVAIRRNERNINLNRQTRGSDITGPSTRPTTTDARIASGRRSFVRELLTGSVSFVQEGGDKWRLESMPSHVKSDMLRAEILRPPFDALVSTFDANDDSFAVEQVRLQAHEHGFHLSSCPKGCELYPPGKPSEDD